MGNMAAEYLEGGAKTLFSRHLVLIHYFSIKDACPASWNKQIAFLPPQSQDESLACNSRENTPSSDAVRGTIKLPF